MSRTLECLNELPLMFRAGTRNPAGNNPALLGNKSLQFFLVFIIDVNFFVIAEAAAPAFPYLPGSPRSPWSTRAHRTSLAAPLGR